MLQQPDLLFQRDGGSAFFGSVIALPLVGEISAVFSLFPKSAREVLNALVAEDLRVDAVFPEDRRQGLSELLLLPCELLERFGKEDLALGDIVHVWVFPKLLDFGFTEFSHVCIQPFRTCSLDTFYHTHLPMQTVRFSGRSPLPSVYEKGYPSEFTCPFSWV